MGSNLATSVARTQGVDNNQCSTVKTLDQRLAQRAASAALDAKLAARSNANWRVLDLGVVDDAVDVLIAEHNAQEARAHQASRRGTNSQKEPVPKPSSGRGSKKTEVDEDHVETSRERIERLAEAAYEANAAIDEAIGRSARERKTILSPEQMAAKKRVVWTPEVADELMLRVAEGQSVYSICNDEHMPHRVTAYEHIGKDSALATRYQAALHTRADKLMEQVVEESRILKERAAHGASTEEVKAHQVYINSLQWTAAKLNPAKYGDRAQVDLNASLNVNLTSTQIDMKLMVLLNKMAALPKAITVDAIEDGDTER